MVKKVITNFNLSKASGCRYIPVVVLKNCETKRSYILAELFNKCLKEWLKCLIFQIVESSNRWSLYLKMLGKDLQLKTAVLLAFFLWLEKSLRNL